MVTLTLNLLKLQGAYIAPLQDGTGEALVIPTNNLFAPQPKEGKERGVYVTISDYTHMPNQWDYTHTYRQVIDRDTYDRMTEEERKLLPIIGRGK